LHSTGTGRKKWGKRKSKGGVEKRRVGKRDVGKIENRKHEIQKQYFREHDSSTVSEAFYLKENKSKSKKQISGFIAFLHKEHLPCNDGADCSTHRSSFRRPALQEFLSVSATKYNIVQHIVIHNPEVVTCSTPTTQTTRK
jgi:hypothetical protein